MEGMTEIIKAYIIMEAIIIQSHSSVGIGKGLCFIIRGTGLFMGTPDKNQCGILFYLCKTSETSNEQEAVVFQ
jgi:hypothetical protein